MKKNKKVGLYVHVPYCAQKCAYCDFYSLSDSTSIDAYTDALIANIKEIALPLSNCTVDTVFFGGGTPSLLGAHRFGRICDSLNNELSINDDCEFTVEVNPATVSCDLAEAFALCGVNRVSIGLQSSDERELRALSRIHSFDDFKRTYSLISERVTDNISVDIMYGIPLQNITSLTKTIGDVLLLSPSHISAYCLKIEPLTPFGRMGESLILPDEDEQEQMYKAVCDILTRASYNRYEISNFAREGKECQHNLKYWNREEYVGLGPAAHSFFNGCRYSYSRDLKKYINKYNGIDCDIIDEKRKLTADDIYNEEIMLGLRLERGIIPDEKTLKRAQLYIDNGFMSFTGNRLFFTTKGFLVSNYILSELIQ